MSEFRYEELRIIALEHTIKLLINNNILIYRDESDVIKTANRFYKFLKGEEDNVREEV